MQIDTSIIVALIALLGTILVAALNFGKMSKADAIHLEHRLTGLESKIEPIWEAILQEIPKLLISPHTPEFDDLVATRALTNMPLADVDKLLGLLNIEYEVALKKRDSGRAIGIVLMRAGMAGLKAELMSK